MSIVITGCASNNTWMKDNRKFIDNKTISELIIPGTHLANAYNIKGNESLCIGEAVDFNNMSVGATLRHNMLVSGQYNQESFITYLNTQKKDVPAQLNDGVRYFELQVCQQNNVLYTSNVYLTDQLNTIITQIDDFVDSHLDEIVIIDLDNNLWAEYGAMNIQDATKLYNSILSVIGHNFIPKSMRYNTLSQLKAAHKRVVLLSGNVQLASFPFVWDKTQIAVTKPAQYSTIQKISAIQNIYAQSENTYVLNIVPLYSVLPPYSIGNGISSTNNDDPIILNYLSQTIANHPMIIVTDYHYINAVIDMAVPNNRTAPNEQNESPDINVNSKVGDTT